MSRVAMTSMQTCAVALAALAFLFGPLQTPVFDANAREHAPVVLTDNDVADEHVAWSVGSPRALFEVKEYRLAMSQIWLNAAEQAGGSQRTAFARIAVRHAKAALAYGPANGYAWLSLAWAEFFAGNHEDAWEALQTSWEWSPYTGNLFLSRVILASNWWPQLTEEQRDRVMEELWVARLVQPDELSTQRSRNPRLDAVYRLVWAQDRARRGVGFE